MASDPLDNLVAGAEQWLADLDEIDFQDLIARVRVPSDGPQRTPAAGRAEAKRRFGK